MDKSADPCTDFFQYACGGWNKRNPIPADQARWDVYGKLAHENQRLLWGILEQAAKPDAGRGKVQQETGDYFHACMDEAAIEKAGVTPLKPVLNEIASLKSLKDLTQLLSREHLQLQGNNMMFGFGSNQDLPTRAASSLSLSREDWACPTATTTLRRTPSRLKSARGT